MVSVKFATDSMPVGELSPWETAEAVAIPDHERRWEGGGEHYRKTIPVVRGRVLTRRGERINTLPVRRENVISKMVILGGTGLRRPLINARRNLCTSLCAIFHRTQLFSCSVGPLRTFETAVRRRAL